MKISGFTIVRNGIKLHYPVVESIKSILPICDEFIVNVGDSQDGTLDLVRSIDSPKIRIIQTQWDMTQGAQLLSHQTNLALKECKGDWAFYLQTDEVIHETDLPKLKHSMQQYLHEPQVDALRFKWLHFYGSHWRYRIDAGWYQKQDRIVRNNGQVQSFGDAFAFCRKDGKDLQVRNIGCFVYHYGWVFNEEIMAKRRLNQGEIWSDNRDEEKKTGRYEFGDLKRFPVYFGSHPATMKDLITAHPVSGQDWSGISRQYWWNPALWLRLRYKTGHRIKERIA